jgi:hypothetical protein
VKYVAKGSAGVRKQALVIGGQNVFVFVKTKVTACKSLVDKTASVVCKVINSPLKGHFHEKVG